MPDPTIGRIVHYTLGKDDAAAVNRRRADALDPYARRRTGDQTGFVLHTGNTVSEGDVLPAMVVRAFPAHPGVVSLQVYLDGNDTFWATSRREGDTPYAWHWPERPTSTTPSE